MSRGSISLPARIMPCVKYPLIMNTRHRIHKMTVVAWGSRCNSKKFCFLRTPFFSHLNLWQISNSDQQEENVRYNIWDLKRDNVNAVH